MLTIVVDHCPWFKIDFRQGVYLQKSRERVVVLDIPRLSRKYNVPKLDTVFWQTVNEVEIEVG
jgi:hypothetical protein